MVNNMQEINYFFIQTKYNIKNAYALRKSFWIGVFGMMMNNLTFFVIWLLFMQATGPIKGWTSIDVIGMLGVSLISFGFTHSFFYGVVELPQHVTKGSFDSILLAPVNKFLKIGGSSFSVTAYGDLIQGILATALYVILAKFTFYSLVLYLLAIVLGCIIFLCIRLICSSIVFFIYDGETIASQLFEIFLRPGLYPGPIFPNKLKLFFMIVIPTLLTSAVPVDVVKTKSPSLLFFSFIITTLFVLLAYFIFRIAVRRYESGNLLR